MRRLAVSCVIGIDWSYMAQRICRGHLRRASIARGVGRLDIRMQGRTKWSIFHAFPLGLFAICAAPRRAPLHNDSAMVRARTNEQANARDLPLRITSPRLLAPWAVAILRAIPAITLGEG